MSANAVLFTTLKCLASGKKSIEQSIHIAVQSTKVLYIYDS